MLRAYVAKITNHHLSVYNMAFEVAKHLFALIDKIKLNLKN